MMGYKSELGDIQWPNYQGHQPSELTFSQVKGSGHLFSGRPSSQLLRTTGQGLLYPPLKILPHPVHFLFLLSSKLTSIRWKHFTRTTTIRKQSTRWFPYQPSPSPIPSWSSDVIRIKEYLWLGALPIQSIASITGVPLLIQLLRHQHSQGIPSYQGNLSYSGLPPSWPHYK